MNFVMYLMINMTLPRLLDHDPGPQGKPMNSWCVSFETAEADECIQLDMEFLNAEAFE